MSPSVLTSADMFNGRETVLHGSDGDQEIVPALIQHQILRARTLLLSPQFRRQAFEECE